MIHLTLNAITMKYEARVKYSKVDDFGKVKEVTENYVVADAETWANAELQTFDYMAELTSNTIIPAIKISDIEEIIQSNGEWFYKSKIGMSVIDELSGKEKTTTVSILVQADDFAEAQDITYNWMSKSVFDCELLSISKSKIIDVFEPKFKARAKLRFGEENESND